MTAIAAAADQVRNPKRDAEAQKLCEQAAYERASEEASETAWHNTTLPFKNGLDS